MARIAGVELAARQEHGCFRGASLIASTTSGSRAHSSASLPAAGGDLRQRGAPGAAADDCRSLLMPSPPRRAPCSARSSSGQRARAGASSGSVSPRRSARRRPRRSSPHCRCTASAGGTLKRAALIAGELLQRGADRAGWRRLRRRRPAPARRSPRARSRVRSTRQSTTACWKLAAMSAGRMRARRDRALHRALQAGEGEMRLAASRPAGAAAARPAGSPSRASASIAGPPG